MEPTSRTSSETGELHDWMPVVEDHLDAGISNRWEWCTKCGTLSCNQKEYFRTGSASLIGASRPVGVYLDTGCMGGMS